MMSEAKTFDLESIYDEKVAPLMKEIIKVCKENHLPMFATFLYRSDPEGIDDGQDSYCTTQLHFEDHHLSEGMAQLQRCIQPRRIGLRLTIRGAGGNVVDTVIL